MQMFDSIKMHSSDLDCDTDGSSDASTAAHQELSKGHSHSLSFYINSIEYRLTPPLSDILTP